MGGKIRTDTKQQAGLKGIQLLFCSFFVQSIYIKYWLFYNFILTKQNAKVTKQKYRYQLHQKYSKYCNHIVVGPSVLELYRIGKRSGAIPSSSHCSHYSLALQMWYLN